MCYALFKQVDGIDNYGKVGGQKYLLGQSITASQKHITYFTEGAIWLTSNVILNKLVGYYIEYQWLIIYTLHRVVIGNGHEPS